MESTKEDKSDSVYEELIASIANPRQRESLDRIKAASDYLKKAEIKISLARIEHYCIDRWNGPKAQSIRNSTETLFRYVNSCIASQRLPGDVARKGPPEISDESIRLYVEVILQELKDVKADRDRIKAGLRTIPGISVDRLLGATEQPEPDTVHTVAIAKPLRPKEILALAKILDSAALTKCGLELFKDRIRQQTTKNVLLEKEEVEVLRELVGSSAQK
jgi:hypothetical protein